MASTEKKSSLPPAVSKYYYLHHKSKRIAGSQFRFAITGAAAAILLDLLVLFTKERFQEYAKDKPEFEDWNKFFELKEWIQWTIFGTVTCWLSLEIVYAKLLQYAVNNESRPALQIWLILYTMDMLLAFSTLATLIFFVIPTTKILLGIIGLVFSIMEIYYFSILYRFYLSLKTTARYEVCQTDEDKLSLGC